MGISSPLPEWDGCDTQTPPSFPVNSCTWPMPLCVKEWNIGSKCCPGFLSTCSGCPVAMTLIKHVCLSFLWNSCWRTRPFHGKRITPFYQRGQTDECASNLGCINKFFSCLSMLCFSCLCSFCRWLSRLLTPRSWEDWHHKWPVTMGTWPSRAGWLQLRQNQRRSAAFRPLYSLYMVLLTRCSFTVRNTVKVASLVIRIAQSKKQKSSVKTSVWL